MKYQIWFSDSQQVGTFTKELDLEESKAFEEELGFKLRKEFESDSKEEATQHFIEWCNNQTGSPNKVERVNLVGTLQRALEEEEGL